jgi:hypothetical protein
VRLLLESLRPFPAYILNRTSDFLAGNPEALALFTGLHDWSANRRNTIRYVFRHPAARALLPDWEEAAGTGVANLRTVIGDDPGLHDLVAELTAESPDFVRLWERYDVAPRRTRRKRFCHPVVGNMTLTHEVLRLSDDDQRLCVYEAIPGTSDHDALTLLAMTHSLG